jgi:hypothetical protein
MGHPATRSQLYVFDGLAEGFTKLASEPQGFDLTVVNL